jgi:NAD(P)-dependent dehydrogenase (short-subunit alcohol dehydrogenase family)
VATELNALSSSRKNITVLQADITDVKALEVRKFLDRVNYLPLTHLFVFVQLAANKVSEVTGGKLDFLINNAAKSNHPGFTLDGL